jgi:5'-3' exonuclease
MSHKDLLELLNNMDEVNDTVSSPHERVLLIDGLNLFFRNFAMLNIVNEHGVHVGGLGGFIRSLGTLINAIQPTSMYVIFDGENSSMNRKNVLSEYKAGRHLSRITNWEIFDDVGDEHDAKVDQIVRLIDYLKCLPIKTLALDKVEADDIIAHLATTITNNNDNSRAYIVSSDKDFIQLTSPKIVVYRPIEKDYYTPDTVVEKFGVLPENFILYKVLMGDASDKVPGIKGLGIKKLHKLFPELNEQVLTLDDIIEISARKYKENIIYSRVVFEEKNLRKNYQIMDLHNPMMDKLEKEYIESQIEEKSPLLNAKMFLKFYQEDGLRHLIKNPEFWVNNQFRTLNSFVDDSLRFK